MSDKLLRLSDHQLSKGWISQFYSSEERAIAADLLNQLKLVPNREFEAFIEGSLTSLQSRINTTIAVFPIRSPIPEGVIGYDQFSGAIPKDGVVGSREIGRRRKYGSEDRVGHILSKLQDSCRKGTGCSSIECAPTVKQITTQRIKHIVLVDDVCGSGRRIADYWKEFPRIYKRLLSLKRLELWVVLYTYTTSGLKKLKKTMPNFPVDDHLISAIPAADLTDRLTLEMINLCTRYGDFISRSDKLGYKDSACPIVFEHGCPNNLPAILWVNEKRNWKALFPNRSIPGELKVIFDEAYTDRTAQELWNSNQPRLAMSLLDSLDGKSPLSVEQWILLTVLGLCLAGVEEDNLARRMLISTAECFKVLETGAEMGFYDAQTKKVTELGKEVVKRFRERFDKRRRKILDKFERDLSNYYPSQCEGKLLCSGKTA